MFNVEFDDSHDSFFLDKVSRLVVYGVTIGLRKQYYATAIYSHKQPNSSGLAR